MLYKFGVINTNSKRELYFALGFAELASQTLLKQEITVTSMNDSPGVHLETSLHYKDLAFDIRTHGLSVDQRALFFNYLKIHLSPYGFDIGLEYPGEAREHIHIEYDPKGRQLFRWTN